MAIKECTRYQASWGDWYVGITLEDQYFEFRFDHFPSSEEVDSVVANFIESMKELEPMFGLEAENGKIA